MAHLKYRLAVPTASSVLESKAAMASPSKALAAGASVATTTAWDAEMVCPPATLTCPGCPGMGPVTDSTLTPVHASHVSRAVTCHQQGAIDIFQVSRPSSPEPRAGTHDCRHQRLLTADTCHL